MLEQLIEESWDAECLEIMLPAAAVRKAAAAVCAGGRLVPPVPPARWEWWGGPVPSVRWDRRVGRGREALPVPQEPPDQQVLRALRVPLALPVPPALRELLALLDPQVRRGPRDRQAGWGRRVPPEPPDPPVPWDLWGESGSAALREPQVPPGRQVPQALSAPLVRQAMWDRRGRQGLLVQQARRARRARRGPQDLLGRSPTMCLLPLSTRNIPWCPGIRSWCLPMCLIQRGTLCWPRT